jgi:hypothetical protein
MMAAWLQITLRNSKYLRLHCWFWLVGWLAGWRFFTLFACLALLCFLEIRFAVRGSTVL